MSEQGESSGSLYMVAAKPAVELRFSARRSGDGGPVQWG
jgi:hypothetical protein